MCPVVHLGFQPLGIVFIEKRDPYFVPTLNILNFKFSMKSLSAII